MKTSLTAGFPVHMIFARIPLKAMLLCAVLSFASPSMAEEMPNVKAAPAAAVHELTGKPPVADNPVTVSPGTSTFQGLIPPAGSAIVNPAHAADKSTAPAATPTATVTYGAAKPDGEDTHPTLNLTADRAELVRLDSDAASVIVGNPENLNIQLENRKLLVLTPAKAGATYLSILDDSGAIIMQRHVIVSSPKNNYIRIRRSCNGSANCQQTSVYYCPGMCHAVGGSSAMPSGTAAPSGNNANPDKAEDAGSGNAAPPEAPTATMTVNPASTAVPQ